MRSETPSPYRPTVTLSAVGDADVAAFTAAQPSHLARGRVGDAVGAAHGAATRVTAAHPAVGGAGRARLQRSSNSALSFHNSIGTQRSSKLFFRTRFIYKLQLAVGTHAMNASVYVMLIIAEYVQTSVVSAI